MLRIRYRLDVPLAYSKTPAAEELSIPAHAAAWPRSRAVEILSPLLALVVGCGRSELLSKSADAGGTWGLDDGGPGLACPDGETACKGVCVDTQTDDLNCGTCGNRCSAVAPSSAGCISGRCLVTLYTARSHPMDLAIDAKAVYWTNLTDGKGVMKVPRAGGRPTILDADAASGISVDGKSVYWAPYPLALGGIDSCVVKAPLNGGAATRIVQQSAGDCAPMDVAISTQSIYWTNYGRDTVMMAPLAGGKATTLSAGEDWSDGIAVDGSSVYWTMVDQGAVMKAALDGGPATVLASGQESPARLAADATGVYWTNADTYDKHYSDGAVLKASPGGGTPIVLAAGQSWPNGIAVDGAYVYWANWGNGTVMKVPCGGGDPVTLASGRWGPWDITVDESSVFWTDQGDVDYSYSDIYGPGVSAIGAGPPGAVVQLSPK